MNTTLFLVLAAAAQVNVTTAGPLRIDRDNPRYFADNRGRAVWLTGSHTWANFQERGIAGVTPNFDYAAYLDFLQKHHHNFIRLWCWEQAHWMQFVAADVPIRYAPLPYLRTGPGQALDGAPKFDLTKFNEAYFARLRARVVAARERGIYVSVMLFQGFSLDKRRGKKQMGNAWRGHPLNAANNINGIDGNPSHDDTGHETHELAVAKITTLQESYVRKVIDTVGDLDNVLWEIGNECHAASVPWQYHMIRFIKRYERSRPMQHPVGMTGAPINAADLFASPADWISPAGKKWLTEPPANAGKKVVLVDTDHCAPWDHEPDSVWKNFFRGNQFLLMDGYVDYRLGSPASPDPVFDPIRATMGRVRQLAERLDLATLHPDSPRASSGYCLASTTPQNEVVLAYVRAGATVTVKLESGAGKWRAKWISTATGQTHAIAPDVSGPQLTVTNPLSVAAVLHCSIRQN